jgi:hypothetical protein
MRPMTGDWPAGFGWAARADAAVTASAAVRPKPTRSRRRRPACRNDRGTRVGWVWGSWSRLRLTVREGGRGFLRSAGSGDVGPVTVYDCAGNCSAIGGSRQLRRGPYGRTVGGPGAWSVGSRHVRSWRRTGCRNRTGASRGTGAAGMTGVGGWVRLCGRLSRYRRSGQPQREALRGNGSWAESGRLAAGVRHVRNVGCTGCRNRTGASRGRVAAGKTGIGCGVRVGGGLVRCRGRGQPRRVALHRPRSRVRVGRREA